MTSLPLEYWRLVLSWPAVSLYLGLFLIWVLREPLKAMVRMKFTGGGVGVEFERSQAVINEVTAAARKNDEPDSPAASAAPQLAPAPSGWGSAGVVLGAEGAGAAPDDSLGASAARSEARRAASWEFKALDSMLVERTKLLLDQIIQKDGMTVGEVEAVYAGLLPAEERLAMLQALINTRLIVLGQPQGLLTATGKGRAYAEYRQSLEARLVKLGLIKPVPPPAATPDDGEKH